MSTVGNWQGAKIVNDGLVFYLDPGSPNSYFNKNGTFIKDISNNSYTGSLTNGPIYSTNGSGSIILDGLNDAIGFGNIAALNFTTPFSIGCWFKAAATQPSTDGPLIGNINGTYTGYMLWYNNTTVDFYFNYGVRANSSTIITADTWYYVVGVWTGTLAQIYLNGVLNVSSAYSTPPLNGAPSFSLGTYVSSRYFKGSVSIAQAYNKALSSTEVLQNFNATRARFGI
jgi:hypothetical protein